MAVFLLKAKFGSAHIPPPCTGTVFADVPCSGGPFDPWIEELRQPADHRRVRQRQLLSRQHGDAPADGGLPPEGLRGLELQPARLRGQSSTTCRAHPERASPTGSRSSPRAGSPAAAPVSPPLFCPTNPNNRGQMTAFLVKTFGLVLYGG
jgi:hypothetical protein